MSVSHVSNAARQIAMGVPSRSPMVSDPVECAQGTLVSNLRQDEPDLESEDQRKVEISAWGQLARWAVVHGAMIGLFAHFLTPANNVQASVLAFQPESAFGKKLYLSDVFARQILLSYNNFSVQQLCRHDRLIWDVTQSVPSK
jgi:hypothetical protein